MCSPFLDPIFYQIESITKSSGMGTASVLDLENSLEGRDAWANAVNPGVQFKKKTVVITADWLEYPCVLNKFDQVVTLIQWLRWEGFPIVLCLAGEAYQHRFEKLEPIRVDPRTGKAVNGGITTGSL